MRFSLIGFKRKALEKAPALPRRRYCFVVQALGEQLPRFHTGPTVSISQYNRASKLPALIEVNGLLGRPDHCEWEAAI